MSDFYEKLKELLEKTHNIPSSEQFLENLKQCDYVSLENRVLSNPYLKEIVPREQYSELARKFVTVIETNKDLLRRCDDLKRSEWEKCYEIDRLNDILIEKDREIHDVTFRLNTILKILSELGLPSPEDILCISDWKVNMEVFRSRVVEEGV